MEYEIEREMMNSFRTDIRTDDLIAKIEELEEESKRLEVVLQEDLGFKLGSDLLEKTYGGAPDFKKASVETIDRLIVDLIDSVPVDKNLPVTLEYLEGLDFIIHKEEIKEELRVRMIGLKWDGVFGILSQFPPRYAIDCLKSADFINDPAKRRLTPMFIKCVKLVALKMVKYNIDYRNDGWGVKIFEYCGKCIPNKDAFNAWMHVLKALCPDYGDLISNRFWSGIIAYIASLRVSSRCLWEMILVIKLIYREKMSNNLRRDYDITTDDMINMGYNDRAVISMFSRTLRPIGRIVEVIYKESLPGLPVHGVCSWDKTMKSEWDSD